MILGSYESDVRAGTVSLSASLRSIIGLAARHPGSLTMEEFLASVHPGDRDAIAAVIRPRAVAAASALPCRFVRASGGTRWTVLRADVMRGPDGEAQRVVGLVFDITAGHDAYLAVLAAFKAVGGRATDSRPELDGANAALVICDDTRALRTNSLFDQLAGRDDVWGRFKLADVSAAVATSGRFGDQVWRVRAKDDRATLVLVSAAAIQVEKRPAVLVAFNEAAMRFESQSLLAESEERAQRLAGAAPEGLLFTEKNVVLDANEAAATAIGYTIDDLRGTPLLDLIEPDAIEGLRAWLAEAQPGPRVVSLRHRDGRSRLFELTTRVMDRDDRKLRVTSLKDVSERHRADAAVQALRDSREQFRQLAEAHGEGVALQEGGRIVHANSKLASMFGCDAAAMIGRPLAAFSRPDTRDLSRHEDESEDPYVFTARRHDGSTFSAEVLPHHVNVDGRTYRVATIRDVTRRERLQQLRRALFAGTAGVAGLEFFRALVGHLAAAFQVKYAMVAEFSGQPPSGIEAVSLWHHDALAEPFRRPLAGTPCEQVLLRGTRCFPNDVRQQFPNDRWLAGLGASGYFGVPIFDSGGRPAGLIAVIDDRPIERTDERDDILETFAARAGVELQRLRAEQEIRKLNAALEQRVADRTAELKAANEELEAFSDSVSHDLRAPVRHIAGFVDLLNGDRASLPPPAQEHLAEIGAAAERMGTLIDTLLDFSRLGRADLRADAVDLTALSRAAAAELAADAAARDVRWTFGPAPLVQGDSRLLRQVVTNLLSNAVKYTRPRATATIETGVVASPRPGEVVWFVRDNGVGFDMARARKLFGVFQRLHPSSQFEGTGIGLANVQRIVTRHGGRVWAESRVNDGATFFIALPAAAATRHAAS